MTSSFATSPILAIEVELLGRVQGVGFRPALFQLARQLGLTGWVTNTYSGVLVHLEGPQHAVDQFVAECSSVCPPPGAVTNLKTRIVARTDTRQFSIVQRADDNHLRAAVPVDAVTCQACMQEFGDPRDQRHGYLLITCSQCGPRYSIIDHLPFDRAATSMREFRTCKQCAAQYIDPADRRLHSQAIACPKCGPSVTHVSAAIAALRAGKIVAVRGIGGYQLLADARNRLAIRLLRERKGRPKKPLAIIVQDLSHACQLARLSDAERRALSSSAGPIVVVRTDETTAGLPRELSSGLSTLGIMLPSSALHAHLVAQAGPLVVTSANLEGEPIAYRVPEAQGLVGTLADVLVDHDRDIRRPIDDSILRQIHGSMTSIRLARGMAPCLLRMNEQLLRHSVVAVGAHQKVAIALCNGQQAVLGSHIGDMSTERARERFNEQFEELLQLYQCRPCAIAADLHPDYHTSRWAEHYCAQRRIRLIRTAHHHAHIAAAMVEADWMGQTVLGIAWDGTGLGTDGTIWGGEGLVANPLNFQRVARVRPFALPGGEQAILQPARVTVALLEQIGQAEAARTICGLDPRPVQCMIRGGLQCPSTTSMGRLFDAVAALILPRELIPDGRAAYEGQFAELLECHCDTNITDSYGMPLRPLEQASGVQWEMDWRPMLDAILADKRRGTPAGEMAMRFHRGLAAAADELSQRYPELPVVLAGGTFQNRVLVELIASRLESRGVRAALPGMIPVNDGGLAAGQLAIALSVLEQAECV